MVAGAPTMETSTGVFVAGNAAHKLQTLPTEGLGTSRESLVSESSSHRYESGWRYEEKHLRGKQDDQHIDDDKQDKQDGMDTVDPTQKDTIEPPKETETRETGQLGENVDAEQEGEGTTDGNGEKGTPKVSDEEEIPLGFSPGDTIESKSERPPVNNNNKFDKYYHQNLICTKTIHTYICFKMGGYTSPILRWSS